MTAQCPPNSVTPPSVMALFIFILSLASVALAQNRYWGSYTVNYPAEGGGDSGVEALARQEQERGWSPVPAPRQEQERGRSYVPAPAADPPSFSGAEDLQHSGQYVHNPDWDLTPYQLYQRKKGIQVSANTIPARAPETKVVTVRRQKPVQQTQQYQQPQVQQQPSFQNFQAVQETPRQAYQQPAAPRQAYQQPAAPRQSYQQPAAPRQAYQQPAVPAYQQPAAPAYQQPAAPAYQPKVQQQQWSAPQQQTQAAYPRAQHQTYTDEYIFEANNNAQRIYSYTAPTYAAQAKGGDVYSYQSSF